MSLSEMGPCKHPGGAPAVTIRCPFFSGAFDDPEFDMLKHPTARAGITCTVCHAITNVNSVRGNADYTIEEPLHYPFANSENAVLQWINNQLVKAKPSFHKKTVPEALSQELLNFARLVIKCICRWPSTDTKSF